MHKKSFRVVCFAWCVCLIALRAASAGPLQDDLKQRRTRAMDMLGADSIAIFWSAPSRVYSLDVDYEYRQDSNLLYLTGLDQPDTILVLMPGNRTKREILFVREADARREHWNGHSLTPAEASEQTGIETVLTGNQFEPFVAGILSGQGGADRVDRTRDTPSSRRWVRPAPASRCCSSRSGL